MCGIFGYISSEGKGPDIHRLRRIALVTQTRGEHAFGLAWLEEGGTIQTWKAPGAAEDHLDELERCRNAVIMIGHCRFATHGHPSDNRNNHPHVAGAGYIVHNGVTLNHDQLVRQHGLVQRTQCDSEALGLLMAKSAGSIAHRAAWATEQTLGELAMLGIWRGPARMLLVRRGRPLHFGQGHGGFYIASLAAGLPGKVKAVADRSARVLAYDNGDVRLDGDALPLDVPI